MKPQVPLFIVSALFAAACGKGSNGEPAAALGPPDEGWTFVPQDPAGDAAATPTHWSSSGAPPAQLAICGQSGNVRIPTSPADLQRRITGAWLYCSDNKLFSAPNDGIELYEDGEFAFLKYDEAGVLQPQSGFDGAGTWVVEQTGPESFVVKLQAGVRGDGGYIWLQENPSALELQSSYGNGVSQLSSATDADVRVASRLNTDAGVGANDGFINADACGVAGHPLAKPNTKDELLERMLRPWLYCSGYDLGATPFDGLQLFADGTWLLLRYNEASVLEPQRGFDGGGTWRILDAYDGMFQVNLEGPGPNIAGFMAFQEHPSALRIGGMGADADFVAIDESLISVAPKGAATPDDEVPTGSAACAVPGFVLAGAGSGEQLSARVLGRWLLCSGFEIFGAHDAIDVKDDGSFTLLATQADGSLQPIPNSQGTWSTIDPASTGDTAWRGVTFELSSGGGVRAYFTFQEGPTAVRVSSFGGTADYVWLGP